MPEVGQPSVDNLSGEPSHLSPSDPVAGAASDIQHQASALASKVEDHLGEQIVRRQHEAGDMVEQIAGAVGKAGDELADHGVVGQVVKHAADALHGVSADLANKSPHELLDSVRKIGRDSPATFIGASVLLGFALGRFAKSSAPPQAHLQSRQDRAFSPSFAEPSTYGAGHQSEV